MDNICELEIYSDINCVWCYFDHEVIKRLCGEYRLKVIRRAFPLHPEISQEGLSFEILFSNNLSLMEKKMEELDIKASSLGLPLARRTSISNSRLAQELAKWAEVEGRSEEYYDAVYNAYFVNGLNIAEPSVLLDVAKAAKLSPEQALSVIKERPFRHAVDQDWKKSEELDIMVAPTYIVNQNRLAGSQPYERLERMLQKNGAKKRAVNEGGERK
jgi:predicted DsbA family dithiol-disulfide isomerase